MREPLVFSVTLARRALLDADDFTLVSIPVWAWSTNTDQKPYGKMFDDWPQYLSFQKNIANDVNVHELQ